MPESPNPNEETAAWPQPSVADIAARIVAEERGGVSPVELEDYDWRPEAEHLAEQPAPAAPPSKAPVERKVWVGALWAVLGPVAVAVLGALADYLLGADLSGLPPWAQLLALALAGGASSLAAGYRARHTPRPDLIQG